jgi:hypothetical protein
LPCRSSLCGVFSCAATVIDRFHYYTVAETILASASTRYTAITYIIPQHYRFRVTIPAERDIWALRSAMHAARAEDDVAIIYRYCIKGLVPRPSPSTSLRSFDSAKIGLNRWWLLLRSIITAGFPSSFGHWYRARRASHVEHFIGINVMLPEIALIFDDVTDWHFRWFLWYWWRDIDIDIYDSCTPLRGKTYHSACATGHPYGLTLALPARV